MKTRVLQTLTLLALLATVAGCVGANGAAPSDSDVTHAVRALMQQQHATFGTGAATPTTGQVSVHNFGCNPAPDHRGYLCETRIASSQPGHGTQTLDRLVRLVKIASGWQATMQ